MEKALVIIFFISFMLIAITEMDPDSAMFFTATTLSALAIEDFWSKRKDKEA